MSRTAYHRAYYYANAERRRASARAARRKAREWQAVIRIVCEAVTDAINDKPPCGGLTGLGDKPYSRDVSRGKAKITAGERSCQPSFPSLLGNSGRGNNAQSDLKPTPGRPACRCAAYRREAQMAAGKPVKSSRQRMAPSVINSARLRVRRNPSKTPCGITISHQGL